MHSKLTRLFEEFFNSERASGGVLILCAVIAVAIANSTFGPGYLLLWHTPIGTDLGTTLHLRHSLEHWINNGLMVIFFLLIGLEIEREVYIGELANPRNASLPIIAAIGGMATPALLHFLLNQGSPTAAGAGIPMATDIAFALGVLALLGDRVPTSLKIFLVALAIIDDLGAILVIALFYVGDFSLPHFALAIGTFGIMLAMNRLKVHALAPYLLLGLVMWYFMLQSGIHATIAGVMLAFAVPFGRGDAESPSYRLQHALHKPVAFLIMPLFALANTGVVLGDGWLAGLMSANSLGIFAGLVLGKPLGIALFSLAAVALGLSRLPDGVTWGHIVAAGFVGGIGFTMSIFITLLAFDDPSIVAGSKIAILLSSLVAGVIGYGLLRLSGGAVTRLVPASTE
jgi:NhaA family Na+:H+ antiporter